MTLQVTFDELNAFLAHHTTSGLSVQGGLSPDTLQLTLRKYVLPLRVVLHLHYIEDGHTLVFHYRMPRLMNAAARVWRSRIYQALPEGMLDIDFEQQQCTLHLVRIEGMQQYFQHFEVSDFVVQERGLLLQGGLRN